MRGKLSPRRPHCSMLFSHNRNFTCISRVPQSFLCLLSLSIPSTYSSMNIVATLQCGRPSSQAPVRDGRFLCSPSGLEQVWCPPSFVSTVCRPQTTRCWPWVVGVSGEVRMTAGCMWENRADVVKRDRHPFLPLHTECKHLAFWVTCSHRVNCVNTCRLDSRISSITTTSCACVAVRFLAGIISWSVDSIMATLVLTRLVPEAKHFNLVWKLRTRGTVLPFPLPS